MKKQRSQKELDAEIKLLEELKTKVPPGMMTDNRAAIQAQIQVLINKLDNDAIYDRWPDDESDVDVRMNALDAMDWRDGSKQEKPSDDWQELVR